MKGACFLFYYHVETSTGVLKFARFGVRQKCCVYVLFDCVIIGQAK